MQEETIVCRKLLDNPITVFKVHIHHGLNHLQCHVHGSSRLTVVVLIAHSGGFAHHINQVNAAHLAHDCTQSRAVVIPEPDQIAFNGIIVVSPAKDILFITGMERTESPASIDLVLHHAHRHGSGGCHCRATGSIIILSGVHLDLTAQYQLPSAVQVGSPSLVYQCAADGGTDRSRDIFHRNGRSRN